MTRRQLRSGCRGSEPLQGARPLSGFLFIQYRPSIQSLRLSQEQINIGCQGVHVDSRGQPRMLAPASDVHPAPVPCRLGTTEVLTGTGPALGLLQPLLFSVQGPALPPVGRWEGRMGARVQVPGCSLGSLCEDRGAGRQAPRASRLLCATTCLRCPTVAPPRSHCGPPNALPPRFT